ncbi:MAG: FkbM family methyltransferase [Ginsengibacter sp.]
MKEILKKILKKFGYQLINLDVRERDPFKDQVKLITKKHITIFDVGACTGDVAIQYNGLFKNPRIYCFEPFGASFEILKKMTSKFKNIECYNIALSEVTGSVNFHVNEYYPTNSMLATHIDSSKNWNDVVFVTKEVIKINSLTLDDFVAQNRIDEIDILKMDTQGTEYEILEGASKCLDQKKIFLIYLEIILMPTYVNQKNLDEILLLLRRKGFSLYNLYNLSYTNAGELRQVDAIFMQN